MSVLKVADAIADHLFMRSFPIVFKDGKAGGDLLHSGDRGCGFAAFLGLMELYERTGQERYLKFVRAAADTMLTVTPQNFQTHSALSGWRTVLKVYEYTGDRKYLDAIVRIANEVVARNQIATRAVWNDINQNKYCEGCGAADWFLLNWQLWQLTGDAAYLDRAETILYSALYYMQDSRGGISCTGHTDAGCFWSEIDDAYWCCTQKGALALCQAAQLCLASDDKGIYVNFFMPGKWLLSVASRPVQVQMDTDYPNTGKLSLKLLETPDDDLSVRIRVPAWSELEGIALNGRAMNQEPMGGFLAIKRCWRKGDTLEVALSLKLRFGTGISGRVTDAVRVTEVDGEKQVEGASLYWGPVMLGIKSPQKPGKRYTLVVPSIRMHRRSASFPRRP